MPPFGEAQLYKNMIDEIDMLNFHNAHSNPDPKIKVCDDCGAEVTLLHGLDNDCDCGACYNLSGQRVTPSSECDEQGHPFDHDF